MRKTFKLFCAAALAALAVSSCYDDSFLRGEIDRLDGRVDSLASALNKDVANLAAIQSSVTTLETSLKQAIADGDAAVKKALEDALAAAQADLKKVKSDLAQALAVGAQNVEDLDKLQAQLEGTVKTLTDAINMVYSDLSERVDFLTSDVETLEAALKALEATVGTNYKDLLKKLDEVDGVVDGHIADMETALEALAAADEKFNKDLVAAVAKIVVSKVEEVNGKIVLTLADGTKVELSKPLSNVDNNGLVTIVEVEGVKYWSIVGAETHTGVPVGHPDYKLDFQINGTTNELEYRVNDGEWISTGVKVEATAENVKVITGFENATDYVKITIAGSEVVLPKYVAENLTASLDRESMFVSYGKSKTVTLTVADADEYYVMSKPDGWKAKFDEEGVLTVTAPTAKAVESDVAELEGEVLVHANTASGKCTVVKLDVRTGKSVSINLDSENNIEIFNATLLEQEDEWDGSIWYTFQNYALYIVDKSDYESANNEDEFFEGLAYYEVGEYLTSTSNLKINHQLGGNYEAGVYEEDTFEVSLSSLTEDLFMSLEPGSTYMVIMCVLSGGKLDKNYDWTYCEYEVPGTISVTAEDENILSSEILLDVEFIGAANTQYYIGAVSQTAMMEMMGCETIDQFLTLPGMMGMPGGVWDVITNYGANMLPEAGYAFLYDGESEQIKLSEHMFFGLAVNPNTTYYVYVYPYNPNKPESEYNYETDLKPYVFTFTTSGFTVNEELEAPTFTHNVSYDNIITTVVMPEDADGIYYNIYSEDDYTELVNSDELLEDLLFGYTSDSDGTLNAKSEAYITPGSSWYVVACALYGNELSPIYDERVEVPSLPINDDDYNCSVTNINKENLAETSVTFATNAQYVAYRTFSTNTWDNFSMNMATTMLKTGDKITCTNLTIVPVVDGSVTVTVDASSQDYVLYSAFNWDEEENKIMNFTTPTNVRVSTWTDTTPSVE